MDAQGAVGGSVVGEDTECCGCGGGELREDVRAAGEEGAEMAEGDFVGVFEEDGHGGLGGRSIDFLFVMRRAGACATYSMRVL